MGDILIVDDDSDLRQAAARGLAKAGHAITEAEDGDAAIARLATGFDLIVTDLAMPKRHGVELIRVIRQNRPETPILAITGEGKPVSVGLDIARRAGATAVLGKPFTLSELTGLVERLLDGERPNLVEQLLTTLPDGEDVQFFEPPTLLRTKVGIKAAP